MNDMNTDVHQDNVPRLEKLAKPRKRTDKTNNYNTFNVKRGALSYQITDSLNKLAQPRRKPATNVSNIPNFSTKNSPTSTGSLKEAFQVSSIIEHFFTSSVRRAL
ncbi:hypothetical protein K0M31_018463 [Melipona bicolor]|uniref:Uncharacterized protein n=1 Tax=Melipona bicolor TaxID=60889 RepID=A0AA40KRY4_9HYME|nr:hypothetical protein K0M31_018463 [Melipona bicolor]